MGIFRRLLVAFRPRSRPMPPQSPPIRGNYEAAQESNEIKNLWLGADDLDADAANSLAVRTKLRRRARQERGNNGHCAGVIRTQANYVIGTGPRLRMQTGSPGMNAMVEQAWGHWAAAIKLPRKLRTMARAKCGDGEAFAVAITNTAVRDAVGLDLRLYECDQMTAPLGQRNTERYVDGITFDEFGNPASYDFLERHPGASWYGSPQQEYRRIPARFVCHWFSGDERPGQHRGVPELTPSLNLFGTGRRYREAVVAGAETAADFAACVQMGMAQEGNDEVAPFTTLPIEKRTLTVLPAGATIGQLRAEQPATTYDTFQRSMLCEEARPLNMPYNIAACDSSGYSYSGGQLDHQTYFVSIDVERQDCEADVLETVFALWFAEAKASYGWTFPASPPPRHTWDWPGRPKSDPQKTATARQIALSCGAASLSQVYAEDGMDFEDEIVVLAADYGVTEEEMRAALLKSNLQKSGGGEPRPAEPPPESPPANARFRTNGHARTLQ